MLRYYLAAIVLLALAGLAPAPPVVKSTEKPSSEAPTPDPNDHTTEVDDYGLEYGRYLQQVVQALEEDKDFAKKLENVSEDHIKTGEVARELEFVKHSVRTKLDELKRLEIDRLRELIRKQIEQNEIAEHEIQIPKHLDVHNRDTFEIKDLKNLILSATKDLEELDKKRRQEFKEYEMEKEYRYRESLKNMTEEERKEVEEKHKESIEKHKEHPKVHHPGSKPQLEQVWEEQDHMPKEEFNPKTFFSLHDVNGDGYLDIQEVEALLGLEVKKIYNENDDPVEMKEEYNRMREHIYKEVDTNRDSLISRDEFLDMTKKAGFEQDEGWKGLDEQQVYNEDDLREYEKHRQEELRKMYETYGNQLPNHVYPGDMPYYAYDPQAYYPPPQGGPYGQYPQGGPPQYYQQPQYPQQGGMHPQMQQPGMHPQGIPQQQGMHPQQGGIPPQQGMHPQQQGMHPQQGIPQQQGMHPQQGIPQQQGIQAPQGVPQQQQPGMQQGAPQQQPGMQAAPSPLPKA